MSVADRSLSDKHLKDLINSGISEEWANYFGYKTIRDPIKLQRLRFEYLSTPGLFLPSRDVNGKLNTAQYKPDNPRKRKDGSIVKYESPKGRELHIHVPLGMGERVRQKDSTDPIFITEGIKKADSAAIKDICCVALTGVWNFMTAPQNYGKPSLIGDFYTIGLKDLWIIAFDSDIYHNEKVRNASIRLAELIISSGGDVRWLWLPDGNEFNEKVALDDLLADGATKFDLIEKAYKEPPSLVQDRIYEGELYTQKDVQYHIRNIAAREEAHRQYNEIKAQKLLEASSSQAMDGVAFLESGNNAPPIWGEGGQALWAPGQGQMIFGSDGVGKSAVLQQVCMARIGIRDSSVLGFNIEPSDKTILYLALDRPEQIKRSIARMVNLNDSVIYSRFKEKFIFWKGVLPFSCDFDPKGFAEWCMKIGGDNLGMVIGDSVKDMVSSCVDDGAGIGFNDTVQALLNYGVEVGVCHHNRKNSKDGKPRKLDDVYGSRWLVAGLGSVLNIWKYENDKDRRELTQLKTPYGEAIDPIDYEDNYVKGISEVAQSKTGILMDALIRAGEQGMTIEDIVLLLYKRVKDKDSDYDAYRQRTYRLLKKMCPENNDSSGLKIKSVSPIETVNLTQNGYTRKVWRIRQT